MTTTSLRERRRLLVRALLVALGVSAALAAAQLAVSEVTGSVAIRAAALERLIDLLVHGTALVGVWAATRPPDPRHPYGYARYETLSAMTIGMFLLVSVAVVVMSSVERIADPDPIVHPLAGISVMLPASAASFWLMWFLNRQARQTRSEAIATESSHAWADALTSAAVVAGILLSEAGLERADPMIGLAVSVVIGMRAFGIVARAADRLTDAALVDVGEVTHTASRVPGVVDCHAVRSRGSEGQVRIDLHIHVDPDLSVGQAHDIARAVEAAIKDSLGGVTEVLVHVGTAGSP
jgi:cation diffusion facilitator family transporter